MKQYMTFLKIEGKLSLRSLDGILFGLIMPAGIFLLIASIAGDKQAGVFHYTYLQSAFASLITIGICATAFMGIPLTIADYRDKKILKHFFVTPVSPLLILSVHVIIAMFVSIVSSLIITLLSIVMFDYQMQGHVLLFIGAYFLVMFSMYSIGMLIASLCRSVKSANLVTSLVYFPMLFLSGASIPYELFPKFLQNVADILPLTHGIKVLKQVSLGTIQDSIWISIVVLVVFTIVGSIVSIVNFRWE